jgi:hypothetical protein
LEKEFPTPSAFVLKEVAARDRVTLRKFLRSSGLRKSEGKDLKETEMDWVERRDFAERKELAAVTCFFSLFSSFLGTDFQYQLLKTEILLYSKFV